jgi:hypothetical protein
MLYILVPGLVIWMFACAYAGYHKRFGLFGVVVVIGMVLNTLWMVLGLDAKPLSPNAMVAHAGALFYAISAVALGFLVGRISRAFRASKVDTDE